jgi:hypothetical protein
MAMAEARDTRDTMAASAAMQDAVQKRLEADAKAAGFSTVPQYLDHLAGQAEIARRRLQKAQARATPEIGMALARAALEAGARNVADWLDRRDSEFADREAARAGARARAVIVREHSRAEIDAAQALVDAARMEDAPPAESLCAPGRDLRVVPAGFDPAARGRREPGRTIRDVAAMPIVKFAMLNRGQVSAGGERAAIRYAELKERFSGGQGRPAAMRWDDAGGPGHGGESDAMAARGAANAALYLQSRAVLLPEELAMLEAMLGGLSYSAAAAKVFGHANAALHHQMGMARMALISALWRLEMLYGYADGGPAGRARGWRFGFYGKTPS